jgi:hypothetical protein
MNYFVDETALEIDQKNIYAAIETVTLIPVYGHSLISKLKQINKSWVEMFLPNEDYIEDLRYIVNAKSSFLRKFTEKVIEIIGADQLNLKLMKMTDNKWRKKWERKSYPMENYDQAFYTTLHISKNHPANYQSQVLGALKSDANTSLTKDFGECEL